MAPCLCAPTSHKGSFRCRLHRAAARSVASDRDSWSTVSQTSAAVPCLCAPTSHPGSFRCRLHRTKEASWGGRPLRPSAHAKCLRNPELPPAKAKSIDSVGLIRKAAFTRTNRTVSEAKLRCELNKAMPEIAAGVEEIRITPVEILTKKGKLIVAPVPETATRRVSINVNQEKTALSDAVTVKGLQETIMRFPNLKRPTTPKERRLRARSGSSTASFTYQ